MSSLKFVVVGALIATTGCAGAQTEVVAPHATMPVSLSRGVRDADGSLVREDQKLVVGKFEERRTAWGMIYSLVRLTPETDISEALNEQVKRASGDAVIRTTIRSKPCGLSFVPLVKWLPFFPGCTRVVVTGDIIRVSREGAR